MVVLEEKEATREELKKEETNKKERKWLKYLWHFILIAIVLTFLFFAMKYLNAGEEELSFEYQWLWKTIAIWFSGYLILKGINTL